MFMLNNTKIQVSNATALRPFTKEDAQNALDAIQDVFDNYEIPDETRLELWEHYQTVASEVLIRFGELNPDIGYSDRNGHD